MHGLIFSEIEPILEKIHVYLKYKYPQYNYNVIYELKEDTFYRDNILQSKFLTITFHRRNIATNITEEFFYFCKDTDSKYDFFQELEEEINYEFSLPEKEIVIKGFKYKLVE